jgi:hypothetical protein
MMTGIVIFFLKGALTAANIFIERYYSKEKMKRKIVLVVFEWFEWLHYLRIIRAVRLGRAIRVLGLLALLGRSGLLGP